MYKVNLIFFDTSLPENKLDDFEFILPVKTDLILLKNLYHGNEKKIKTIGELITDPNYICFAYKEKITGKIAYTRWVCINNYYSAVLRTDMIFKSDEALTLDSYTHPDYRYKGLHYKMNIQMLKWLKENTAIRVVFMVIKCFLPHLTKIPLQLGYKSVRMVFYYKKGSIPFYLNLLLKKISIIGSFLSKGVSFLLLPLYTRVLMPADYGKLELVYLVGAFLAMIYGFSIALGYNRIFFHKKDTSYRKKLYTTGQVFSLFCSLIFAFIIINQGDWISKIIFDFESGGFYLKLISIITIFDVMTLIPLNNLRVRQEAKAYVTVSLIQLIIIVSLTIFLVVFAEMGVLGVLYGRLIGLIFTLGILLYTTRREFAFSFSIKQLKLMLGFSIFIIPANLSALILNMSNRYFLDLYQGLDDVGLFSLGAKIAAVIPFLFTEPIKKAFSPYLFELVENPKECKILLAKFLKHFLIGLSIVALSFSLFSRELIMLMADELFHGSHNVVFLLSISYIFLGASGIIVLGIHITKKTWIISVIFFISAIINVFLNIWLIPLHGRMGAAAATLISVIIINLLYLYSLKRVYPVDFKYFEFIKILALVVLFNYMGSFIEFGIIISVVLKLGIIISFIVVLYLLGVISKYEIEQTKLFFSKLKSNCS